MHSCVRLTSFVDIALMGGASSKFVGTLQWRSQDFGSGDLQQKINYKYFLKI